MFLKSGLLEDLATSLSGALVRFLLLVTLGPLIKALTLVLDGSKAFGGLMPAISRSAKASSLV